MPVLFDTTVAVILSRRHVPEDAEELVRVARAAIEAGGAVLPAVAASELLVGERSRDGVRRLSSALSRIPTAVMVAEVARDAGTMGAFLASEGAMMPLPDLLIAATAAWLEVPLLTWDGDYARARRTALSCASRHPGAQLLRDLELHPASRGVGLG